MSYKRRTLSPDSPYAVAAAVLLFLSVGILLVNLAWNFAAISAGDMILNCILPGCGCLLLGVMFLTPKNSLIPTIPPMLFCAAVFALRTLDAPGWQRILTFGFYAVFAITYILTVTGVLRSRNWLLCLSGAPFLFHLVVEGLILGRFPGFASFLPELTVLLPMAALFAVGRGMRRGRLYH